MAAKKSTTIRHMRNAPLRLVASWSAGGGVLTLARASEDTTPPTLFPDEELMARVEREEPVRRDGRRRGT